ncbi:MAG: hypothetical protein ABID79_04520 [Elusimicrobiota bacterium]
MAYTKVVFENPNTGHIKKAPVGFSWTVSFFVFFPPFFRGDWKWGIVMLLLALITSGLSSLVFMFIYNKLYIKDLIGSGFKAKSVESGNLDEISQKLRINIPRLETA